MYSWLRKKPMCPDIPKNTTNDESKAKVKRSDNAGSKRRYKIKLRLWRADPHCHYCGRWLMFEESTIDHKIPRSKGGRYKDNLALCCYRCNHLKSDQDYEEFKRKWIRRTG